MDSKVVQPGTTIQGSVVPVQERHAEIHAEALAAAKKAIADFGPEDTQALNCGFAWVTLRPATHPFVRWCRQNGVGAKRWGTGWWISYPGNAPVQQVDIHYAGAKAYADVIARRVPDIEVFAESRLD